MDAKIKGSTTIATSEEKSGLGRLSGIGSRVRRSVSGVKWSPVALLGIGLNLAILFSSCGGGSSSSSSTPPPPPSPPTLTSLNPIVAMQNWGGFSLAVNGSNFTNSTQVLFNGFAEPTTFVSSVQLQAQIPSVGQTGTFPVTARTGGETTKSLNFFVVPLINTQAVSVTSGAETSGINVEVRGLTPMLSLIAVGVGNSAGDTGVAVPRGGSATVLLVGKGVVKGTLYTISGNPHDISVTQPVESDFGMTTDNMPAVNLSISVSPSAAPGPRDILVTNTAGEIAVFVGGLLVTSGS